MTNNQTLIRIATISLDMLNRMTDCDCNETLPRTHFCLHFLAATALRDLLIDRNAMPSDPNSTDPFPLDADLDTYNFIRSLLHNIDAAPYMTDAMTALLLDNSLCPMHAIDYAICFDDDDPDCAAIRAIHPSHDT